MLCLIVIKFVAMIFRALVALFATTTAVQAGTSGVHAELDIAVIEQAKDVYFDNILKFLNNLQLPDIGDSKNYLHGNHISVNQAASNVLFEVDVPNNAVKLTCNDLSANFYTDSFRGHEWIFVATGHLEVVMKKMSIGMGLSFTTQTLPNGAIVPAVNAVDVLVDIDRSDIDIKIWGNIWSDFASAFEIFFKGTVVDMIRDGVRDTLTTTVPTFANDFIAKQAGVTDIGTFDDDIVGWMLDW